MAVQRSAERTQARILRAALHEFSKKGFDGARIDQIARSAGVSVRMLYHYFGDKKALYRAVLLDRLSARARDVQTEIGSASAALPREHYQAIRHDMHLARLMQWEALGAATGKSKLVDDDGRQARYADIIADLADRQAAGELTTALPADMIMLVVIAVTIYPVCFPQACRLITGDAGDSPAFEERFDRVLSVFGGWLADTSDPGETACGPA